MAGIAKSVYYYWVKRYNEPLKDELIRNEIKIICQKANYTYGYRRVTLELRNKNLIVNHKKVLKIMKELELTCNKYFRKSKRYSSYKGKVGKTCSNILKRRFKTDRPFQKYVTDITEFKTKNGEKLYLSPIMDLYSSEIISFRMSKHPTLDIAIEALKEAFSYRPELGYRATVHSDQGWHYQHNQWVSFLKENSIFQSMSRKGNCLDNSPIENFFGLLKKEMYYGHVFNNFDDLKNTITEYIYFYNNMRIKEKLGGMSPISYRRYTYQMTN